jgi:hypothetical protein
VYLWYYLLHIRTSINNMYIYYRTRIHHCYLAYNFFSYYISIEFYRRVHIMYLYKTSYSIVLRACNRAFVIISARDVSLDQLQICNLRRNAIICASLKSFSNAPRKVFWWGRRRLSIMEWKRFYFQIKNVIMMFKMY